MRLKNLSHIITAAFFVLICGLFWTQIINGRHYYRLSQNNRIRLVCEEAARGKILDYKGRVLADSVLSYDLVVRPQEIKNKTQRRKVFEKLSPVIGMSVEKQEAVYKKNYIAPFADVAIVKDIAKALAFEVDEMSLGLPEVAIKTNPKRRYIYKEATAPILGYLGEISKEQLEDLREYGYRPQDIVGKGGLEKGLDRILRGEDGGMQIEINNRGYQITVLSRKDPAPGTDVRLTIDADIQECAYSLLTDKKGAIIVLDPNDGRIMAMASSPTFDPDIFISKGQGEAVRLLLSDEDAPFLNRATTGQYPPGSIFKIITTAAGLESKRISTDTAFYCPGFYQLGNKRFNCWQAEGHGQLDLKGAIIHSCNVYFFKAAEKIGQEPLSHYAYMFGLSRQTGLGILAEAKGFVPDKNWKRQIVGENWYEGDTVNFSIGQGYVLITPLQAAVMISAIANSGKLVQPYIVGSVGAARVAKPRARPMAISPRTIDEIRNDLYAAVEAGTGILARVEGLGVSGKTGTAQVVGHSSHAWFVGYAPSENPRVAVAVFVEGGGYGGEVAAPIAGAIFKKMKQLGLL
jgi:penicillin-binding protein 2